MRQVLQAEDTNKSGSTINKCNDVTEAADRHTITIANIHVHHMVVLGRTRNRGGVASGVFDVCYVAKLEGKISAFSQCDGVLSNSRDIAPPFQIAEANVTMELVNRQTTTGRSTTRWFVAWQSVRMVVWSRGGWVR